MDKPNPVRVYEALARILERKYQVKISYTLINKSKGENHEHDCDRIASR